MTISPKDVADLRVGDVVEFTLNDFHGAKLTGPLYANPVGALCVGPFVVRLTSGAPCNYGDPTLTVVSRSPRLYINSDRTEPVAGDVARDADSDHALALFIFTPEEDGAAYWLDTTGSWWEPGDESLPKRLRLLVDGETGEVVK